MSPEESRSMPQAFDWFQMLQRSIQANRDDRHHRFLQLATVTQQGEPRNRTLVFRGLDEVDHSLLMCTDRLSAKIDQIKEGGLSEVCWYFTGSREQYRLRGSLELVSDHKVRAEVWSHLSLETRAQFTWPHPGQPRRSSPEVQSPISQISVEADELFTDSPPLRFEVIKQRVHLVDYLSLTNPPQRVICERADGEWKSEVVNP